MNVAQLHQLLGEHIAHGRGGDDLYVCVEGFEGLGGDLVEDMFARVDLEVTDVGWTDDRDRFYTLTATPAAKDQTKA